MRLLLTFARAYPWRSGMTLVALLLGGLAEGVGVSTLLPILSTAIDADSESTGLIPDALAALGIAPSLGPLLGIMVTGIVIKSVLVSTRAGSITWARGLVVSPMQPAPRSCARRSRIITARVRSRTPFRASSISASR
jgi:ATP-binding cassette subfamily C protein